MGQPHPHAAAKRRPAWRLITLGTIVALAIMLIVLLAGCSTTTTPGTAVLASAAQRPKEANAPTISACRKLVTDEDVAIMRAAAEGTGNAHIWNADSAIEVYEALDGPGADISVDPDVAAAMRTASERATAIHRKDDFTTNFDVAAWKAMIAGVDAACSLAGVDMTAPS